MSRAAAGGNRGHWLHDEFRRHDLLLWLDGRVAPIAREGDVASIAGSAGDRWMDARPEVRCRIGVCPGQPAVRCTGQSRPGPLIECDLLPGETWEK